MSRTLVRATGDTAIHTSQGTRLMSYHLEHGLNDHGLGGTYPASDVGGWRSRPKPRERPTLGITVRRRTWQSTNGLQSHRMT
jgi:hypothetical protein